MAEHESLLRIADDLYALPLGEFIGARDQRATEARTAGDAELAAAVKRLRKPATAAWVVNLVVRYDADQISQVLDVGAALREAQEAMSADELRALTKQRRQLTAAVTTSSRSLAREHGQRVTASVADQVEATLTAAMIDADAAEAVRSGLLVSPLATTGVDDLDVSEAVAVPQALGFAAAPRATPEPGRPDLHLVPDPDADEKALEAARGRLAETTEALEGATRVRDEAAAAVERLRAKELQLSSEIDELRRRLADLEASYEEVDDEIGIAAQDAEAAEEDLAVAKREQRAAAAEVDRLEHR